MSTLTTAIQYFKPTHRGTDGNFEGFTGLIHGPYARVLAAQRETGAREDHWPITRLDFDRTMAHVEDR